MAKKKKEADFEIKTPEQLEKEAEANMNEFSKLLDSLSSLHDKKKALWKQIYENAITDRRNSYIMFTNLYQAVHNNTSEHAIHGSTLAKYMERLNKSNEQLIKLAEILDEAVDVDDGEITNEETIYDRLAQIQGLKNGTD